MPTRRNTDGSISFLNKDLQEVGRYAGQKRSAYDIFLEITKYWPESEWATALAVCLAESGGYDQAEGDLLLIHTKMGTSIGIFQIRSVKAAPFVFAGVSRNRTDLLDWRFNIETAYRLWLIEGWKPWGAYRNESYKKQMRIVNKTIQKFLDGQISNLLSQIATLEHKKQSYV